MRDECGYPDNMRWSEFARGFLYHEPGAETLDG